MQVYIYPKIWQVLIGVNFQWLFQGAIVDHVVQFNAAGNLSIGQPDCLCIYGHEIYTSSIHDAPSIYPLVLQAVEEEKTK